MILNNDNLEHIDIELPGLPPDLWDKADKEIRQLIKLLVCVADKIRIPYLLKRVVITDQFEKEINTLLKDRSGTSGYIAIRSNVQAIAKTLWFRKSTGDIGFVVVIDACALGSWSFTNPRCLTTVIHELAHVLYEERHIHRLGEAEYIAENYTRERWLDNWSTILIDEFDVDRLVDSIISTIAKKDDGEPWSLRDLDEANGIDWGQSIINGLCEMPRLIDDRVTRFRKGQINIDEFAKEVIPYINDLLVLLSHTAALYMKSDEWPVILTRIKQTEAARRFLQEHIDTIFDQLDGDHTQFSVTVKIVGEAIEGIFRNCGLSFTTIDGESVYIEVNNPA